MQPAMLHGHDMAAQQTGRMQLLVICLACGPGACACLQESARLRCQLFCKRLPEDLE